MRGGGALRVVRVMAAVTAITSSRLAPAQDKAACASSYEKAQVERQKDHLLASRQQLLVCSQPACTVLQKECVQWLSEVEAALPSLVLEATGPDGRDAVDVEVTCDGSPLTHRLDGKAVSMDPGVHRCRFEMGGEVREDQIVLREGERRRPWRIAFAQAAAAASPSSDSLVSPFAPGASAAPSSTPVWAWILGGAGVAAIGVGSYFELDGFRQKSALDQCKGNCQSSAVDATRASFVAGDVTIGIGLAAAAVATIVLLTHPHDHAGAAGAWLSTGVFVGASAAQLEGRF